MYAASAVWCRMSENSNMDGDRYWEAGPLTTEEPATKTIHRSFAHQCSTGTFATITDPFSPVYRNYPEKIVAGSAEAVTTNALFTASQRRGRRDHAALGAQFEAPAIHTHTASGRASRDAGWRAGSIAEGSLRRTHAGLRHPPLSTERNSSRARAWSCTIQRGGTLSTGGK